MEKIAPLTGLNVRTVEHGPHTRVMFNGQDVTFRPGGGGHTLEMTSDGKTGMFKFIGMPETFEDRLDPSTTSLVATELLSKRGQYDLVVKDHQVVGFTKHGERSNVNPERVLDIVERTVNGAEYNRVMVSPLQTAITLEIVGLEQKPVVKGDLVRAGVMIQFSPLNVIRPTVTPYAVRLVCTNGALSTDNLANYQYGGGDSGGNAGGGMWSWFGKSIKDSYGSLDGFIGKYQRMIAERIKPEDRAMIVAGLIKAAGLTGEVAAAIQARAIETPPTNSWEAYNLVTYASSHLLQDPARVMRAQLAAATYSDETTHARLCPVCRKSR
jgi:hypothetical protein